MYKYHIPIPNLKTCHSVMAAYSYKGVEYQFVNTQTEFLEELQCAICLELVSDPVQTSCGHLFCGECIEGITHCPIDREIFTTTPDHFNKRRVRNFKVKCHNKGRGCQWQGNLGDADKHINTNCDYQIVECDNEGCDEEIERRHLAHHMHNECSERMYNCPFCAEEGTYCEVTTVHFTACEELPLNCPGGCGKQGLQRGNMAHHLFEDCPNELVPCRFAIAGCQQIVKRKDLQQHLKDKDRHLDVVLSSHVTLSLLFRDIVNDRKPKLPLPFCAWLQNTPSCYPRPPWVIKMEGFQKKKERNVQWYSAPVYSHFGGYKMCLKVCANGVGEGKGTHVSVQICMMRGAHDKNLKWPFEGTVEISLLNQLEDSEHYTDTIWEPWNDIPETSSGRVTEGERSEGWGDSEFVPHDELDYDDDDNRQFLKDDTLFFRVDVIEPDLD